MNRVSTVLSLICFLFVGCSTSPSEIKVDTVGINSRTPIMCSAQLRISPGTEIYSIDHGKIVESPKGIPEELNSNIVIKTSSEYFYDGNECTSEFELIYSGLKGTYAEPVIKKNDVIGNALGNVVNLVARSKIIDPFLISCSEVVPVKYEDYWYYNPGMYIPTEMKWLSFKPVKYADFKAMYDHAIDPEEFHGRTIFLWWSLYKTVLDEYPQKIFNDRGETSTQLIYFNELPLRLNYQKGFFEFLQDEYTLGEPIYLYLQITGINGFKKEFDCYVRDFSLESPETIIQNRIKTLK